MYLCTLFVSKAASPCSLPAALDGRTYVHQAEARCRILPVLGIPPVHERSSRTSGVDEELVHVLERIEAVGSAPAEDVDVEAVRLGEQEVGLVRDEGETLEEADAEGAVGDDLCEGEGGGLDVVAALDDLEVGGDGAEVFVGLLVGEVAEAEGLADLAGCEKLLELEETWHSQLVTRMRYWSAKSSPLGECRARDPGCGCRR